MDTKDTRNTVQRLDSWKEIAAFFDRDERTVKRWEKERGLPVHRLPGGAKSRVFAYAEELSRWSTTPDVEQPVEPSPDPSPGLIAVEPRPVSPVASERRFKTRWTVVAALAVMMIGASAFFAWWEHRTVSAVGSGHAPHVPNREAEQLYLSGRFYWNKRTPEDLNKAVDYFTQAIVRDPAYAKAYAGLADAYNLLSEYTSMSFQDAFTRAIAAARRAVDLDDSLAGAHRALAFALFYGAWDARTATREFQRALELDPNDATTHHWFATVLMSGGGSRAALSEIGRAQQLNPSSTSIIADKGLILWHAGRKEEGVALLKQIESSEPSFISTHRYLASIYLDTRDYSSYLVEARKLATMSRDNAAMEVVDSAERGFVAGGARGLLRGMLRVQEKEFAQGLIPAYLVAITCAQLGETTKALEYLQRSLGKRELYMLLLGIDPAVDGLRGEPAFQELLKHVGAS